MHANPVGRSVLCVDEQRLDELMRWHGTDESSLPPAHTLQNLSRDTVAALTELREARATIEQLRAAMGRAFWATRFRDVHAILLEALGPPPGDDPNLQAATFERSGYDPAHSFPPPRPES